MIVKEVRALIATHGLANITMGVGILLWANISAESVMVRVFAAPHWLWPFMFIFAGLTGFYGIVSRPVARFAFFFAAMVTGIFGVASLYSVVVEGYLAAVPTMVFLLYITVLKTAVSRMIRQQDHIVTQIQPSSVR